jgi:hypothetical protein
LDCGSNAAEGIDNFPPIDSCFSTILSKRERPFVTREAGVKHSGSTRKKLRQDWNKLCQVGDVDIINEMDPSAARKAFGSFLALEAAGWKGANGTAIVCNDSTPRLEDG